MNYQLKLLIFMLVYKNLHTNYPKNNLIYTQYYEYLKIA